MRAGFVGILSAITLFGLSGCDWIDVHRTRVPNGYPVQYSSQIDSAYEEKILTIWSSTDHKQIEPVLSDFAKLFPGIEVRYRELSAEDIFRETVQTHTKGKQGADLLWSSAMDLQIKLVNDGHAQPYKSPELKNLPEWAVWKNEAWGITAEPIVFVYNKSMVPEGTSLKTHIDFANVLMRNLDKLKGRVATYDPAQSAAGFLYFAQDQQVSYDTWDLVKEMGAAEVQLYRTTDQILKRMASGDIALAYNMVGSYALSAQRRSPDIAVVLPEDYTLVMSRIALIPKAARSPNAARVFLDYLLSRRGQRMLATRYMSPVRSDVEPPSALKLGKSRERAIRVGPALLVHQDNLTRQRFFARWNTAIQNAPAEVNAPR